MKKRGRPKSKLDLPDGWEERIISLYEQGAGDNEVIATIWEMRGSFSNDLFYRWLDEEERFSETIKKGRALSLAWWESQGRRLNIDPKMPFNTTMWYMNMKNRHAWRDKQEIEHSGEVKIEYKLFEEEKDI